jgi:MFS family permease
VFAGADWLQGPYVYSLYREQYGFPERLVAVLFVTGFVSAGLAAPLVGVWADQHGRRKLCLVFCVTYGLACLFILVPSVPLLLLGRVLGGISTSILFSAFESWLISAGSASALPSADLSTIMGRATLVNGIVATGAGVLSNQLVGWTANFAAPFVASGALLVLGWIVIRASWGENYGGGGGVSSGDMFQVKRLGQAWSIVRKGMCLVSCEPFRYSHTYLQIPSSSSWGLRKHASRAPCTSSFSSGCPPYKKPPP